MDRLLNIREAAEYLSISPHTLYKLVERREVPAVKVGGSWRLSQNALRSFIDARSSASSPQVLILEPIAEERRKLVGYARRRAGHVIATNDVDDAISAAIDANPDVVFLSANLPGGRAPAEVISRIRSGGATSRIVVMVSREDAQLAADALDYGPVILLRRPVDRTDVASILTLITR